MIVTGEYRMDASGWNQRCPTCGCIQRESYGDSRLHLNLPVGGE